MFTNVKTEMEYNISNISKQFGMIYETSTNEEKESVPKIDGLDVIGDCKERYQSDIHVGKGLLSKIKDAINVWAENTTHHGIRYVFDSRASKFRRLVWLLVITGMWIGMVHSGSNQYNRYFDYETVTQDTFRSENKLAFPAVTMCNQCILYNVTGKYEHYKLYQKMKNMTSKEEFDKIQELFGPKLRESTSSANMNEILTTPKDVFLNNCVWNKNTKNCSAIWKAAAYSRYNCLTLDSDIDGKQLFTTTIGRYTGGLEMTVFLDHESCLISHGYGILLAVHEIGVAPNIYVALSLAPGLHHSIGVTINEKTFLPPPVKAFGTSECIDVERPDFDNPLKYSPKYSLSACEAECFSEYVNATCGCISTKKPDQMKLCNGFVEKTCASPAYWKFWDDYNDNVEKCGCRERCKFTTYKTKVSSSTLVHKSIKAKPNITTEEQLLDENFVKENFLKFDVYFDSKVIHVKKQILDFTLGDLGASIGGFFGLAIGASVLTFCEMIDMLVTLTVRLLNTLRGAK